MSRTIIDPEFRVWEAYASAARYPDRPRIVFICRTDGTLRARIVENEGSHADAEREVASASTARLVEWLERSEEID